MNKPMHILQVVHSLAIGGTERVVCDLVRQFNDGEFRTSVCCLDEIGAYGEELRDEGVPVHVLGRKPGVDLSLARRLRDLYRREKVDLIHAHQYTPYFYAATAALRAGLLPVIFTEHGRHWPDRLRIKRAMVNQLLNLTTVAYTAVSGFSRESLIRFEKMPRGSIQVIYNGVDLNGIRNGADDRRTIRRELGLKENDLLVLSVGRLDPIKDFATLIRAFARVAAQSPGARLCIAGDGDEAYKQQLIELGRQLGEPVRLLGARRDVNALLSACDLYALTSITEATSMTILEAMAAKRAVVATRTGGNPELVVDGQTGLLVPVGDVPAMSEAMSRLLKDSASRERMGVAGQARVKELFSKERCFAQYRDLYRSVEIHSPQRHRVRRVRKTYHRDAEFAEFGKKLLIKTSTPRPLRLRGEKSEQQIRIAHLIGSTGMYGAERWILAQLRYLDQSRCPASIINLVDSPGENSAIVSEAKRLGYDAQDLYTGGRFNPLGIFRLAKLLRQSGVKIVHSHGYKSDVMGLIAARLSGVRVISTPHGWSRGTDKKLAAFETLGRVCLKLFDRVCPLSQSLYGGLLADGVAASRMQLVLNGVDLKEIDEAPAKAKANGTKRIGYIGQFVEGKSLNDLVEAFVLLNQRDCELYMIGDGPCRENILRLIAARNGHGGIVCPGYTSDRLQDLKAFDVFVLPSLSEGIPRCVMEAQAAGVPVVATDIQGVRDLVKSEQTGLLVPPRNPAALAEAIDRVLNSPELATRLAKAGRARIEERFSAAKMAAQYEDLYLSLTAETRRIGNLTAEALSTRSKE
jgi:L-malate glycosyltransferase